MPALELKRVFAASPPRLFGLLTEPEELARWWGPHGFTVPEIQSDLRVGGAYRMTMQPPEGDAFHLHGEFREVDPPNAVAYTFVWDPPDPDDRETEVRLSLTEVEGSTELRFHQGVFATEERLALHRGGWSDSFEKLERLLDASR
jgi:uncharacterized protein YndB with AHSA1/START domain